MLKLSEAILLGRHLVDEPRPCDLTHCAFGMAAKGAGIVLADDFTQKDYNAITARWPWLLGPSSKQFPALAWSATNLQTIYMIFDHYVMRTGEWTLEQLVDYVRSIEPAGSGDTSEECHSEAPKAVECSKEGVATCQ